MPVFFDPQDYLARDPAEATSPVEAERLRREAAQRAALCASLTYQAAAQGFEATTALQVFSAAELGSSTFYKLYPSREACLLEAFERCAETIGVAVREAADRTGEPAEAARAGLAALVETLSAEPAVARLALVEIRAGDGACREAHLRWLERLAESLAQRTGDRQVESRWLARMAVGALAGLLAEKARTGEFEGTAEGQELAALASLPGACGPSA